MSRTAIIGLIACLVVAALGALVIFAGDAAEGVADPGNPDQVALGKVAYLEYCAECHGKNLEGQPNWRSRRPDGTLPAPPHDARGHTWHHPDRHLFEVSKYGGQRNAPPAFKSAMPPFEGRLTDRGIWAVLAFIKSKWPDAVVQRQALIDRRAREAGR